jgi:hypothetical protein
MTLTVTSGTPFTTGDTTNVNVTFPSSAVGDMLVTIWAAEPGGHVTTPNPYHAGWCALKETSNTGGITQWLMFFKFKDGTEPATVTFTSALSTQRCVWYGTITGADPYRGIELALVRGSAAVAPDSPNLALPAGAEEVLWLVSAAVGDDTSQITGPPADSDDSDVVFDGGGSTNEHSSLGVAWRVANLSSWDPGAWSATGMVGGLNGALQVTQAVYPAVEHSHANVMGHVRTYVTGTLASPEDVAIDVPTDAAAMLVWVGGGSGTDLELDPSGTPQALTLIDEDIQTNESCHWFLLESPPSGSQTLRVTATGASAVNKTLHIVYVDRFDSVASVVNVTGTTLALSDTQSLAANELVLGGHLDGSAGTAAELFEVWRNLSLDGVQLRRNEIVQGSILATSSHTMVTFGRTGAGGSQVFDVNRKSGTTERHTAIFLSVFAEPVVTRRYPPPHIGAP